MRAYLSERIKRKLRGKSMAELLDIFKRDVLNLGNNKFWDEFTPILADDAHVGNAELKVAREWR